jgi:hypothetical protein
MSLEEDTAVQAAQDTVVQEYAEGYKVIGAPETPVSYQHDINQIPREDVMQEMLNNTANDPEGWLSFGGGYEQHRHIIPVVRSFTISPSEHALTSRSIRFAHGRRRSVRRIWWYIVTTGIIYQNNRHYSRLPNSVFE